MRAVRAARAAAVLALLATALAARAPAPAPATTAAALTTSLRTYNPAFPASSPSLAPADAAWAAASAAARAAGGKPSTPAAAAATRSAAGGGAAAAAPGAWPPGTSAAVKAALPIGADGTVVPLAEPKVTTTVTPPRGSIYYSGGAIAMRDVPGRAVATGGNATAEDPVVATVQPSASIG